MANGRIDRGPNGKEQNTKCKGQNKVQFHGSLLLEPGQCKILLDSLVVKFYWKTTTSMFSLFGVVVCKLHIVGVLGIGVMFVFLEC